MENQPLVQELTCEARAATPLCVRGRRVLPLLDGERLVSRDAEPDHFALSVECIEVDVSNNSQGA